MGKVAKKGTSKPARKRRALPPRVATKKLVTKFGGLLKGAKKEQAKRAAPTTKVRPPLIDEEVGLIPGLPSETDIKKQVGALSAADKVRFTKIRNLLARRLGSVAAARVWLTTPGRGFDGTPLDAVRNGMADLVLEVLENQSRRNPPYA